jgi:tellurium resistance protein TerD
VRVVNKDSSSEVARYDLSEDASIETAMVFGEIYKHGVE